MSDSLDLHRLKIDRSTRPVPVASTPGPGRRLLVAAGLLAAAALALFGGRLRDAVDRARLPEVRVVVAEQETAVAASGARGITANGYLIAARRAALSADTPGRITELLVTEGSVVKKGDVVARLYSDEYEAAVRRAEADVQAADAAALRGRARVEAARAATARVEANREAAGAQVAAAEAERTQARQALERAERLLAERVGRQDELDLARMNGDRAAARVAAAKADRAAADAAVTDAAAMVRVAEADAGVADAQVAVARAARDQAAATLSKCQVRAPFDGVVVLKDAEVGEVVSPQALGGSSRGSVATMVDFASLEVQCKLPEKSLAAVSIGGASMVYLDAFPERGYEGRVDRIWPTADRRESTVEVRVKLASPDDKLRPEMGCRVVFLSDSKKTDAPASEAKAGPPAILVPETSVVTVGGRSCVFVVERGTAAAREVEVGPRRGASLPVTAGLRAGDRVVVSPPPRLEDGDRVNVLEGS